jgi:hypothetical protein
MDLKKVFIIFGFLIALMWGANNLNKAANKLQYEKYNKIVTAKVVDLPLCNRSNMIIVEYQEKRYSTPVSKMECIHKKHSIGSLLQVEYNPSLDEMVNGGYTGAYRLWIAFLIFIGGVFLSYVFIGRKK